MKPKMQLVKAGKIEKMLANMPKPQDVIGRFNQVQVRVARLLTLYPECAGNYNLLHDRYLWYYYGVKFPNGYWEQKLWRVWPSTETISRAFRKLKENGGIQETLKTQIRRGITRSAYEAAMPVI